MNRRRDNFQLIETLKKYNLEKEIQRITSLENLNFFKKMSNRLNIAEYGEVYFGLTDTQVFEYLTTSYFCVLSEDNIFQQAFMSSALQNVFYKLSINRYWRKEPIAQEYDLLYAFQNGIRRSENKSRRKYINLNIFDNKAYLKHLGKENVLGYLVNQEHLDSFDMRLIEMVLLDNDCKTPIEDMLRDIIHQNKWPSSNVLELFLKWKIENG